jgi:hypothetical protein
VGKAQDIDGKWTGSFIQYIHNTYDVEMTISKLAPGNIFSARLRITDGFYFGEYQVSGFICQKRNLEISTIVLVSENENQSASWIDCLNGTWDLNEDENELTFTDTWLDKIARNNTCKLKYIQKDMFQCLRSSYLRKAKYNDTVEEFDKVWEDYLKKKNTPVSSSPLAKAEEAVLPKEMKTETKIVAKNEERAPVLDTFEQVKMRPVYAKEEIEVSNADISIDYWDRYTEDGDSINLYMNKKLLLENVRLTKVKKTIQVHLEQVTNYLIVHALNLGSEPPNTASITVKDGKKIQTVSLTSNLRTSGALKITLKN